MAFDPEKPPELQAAQWLGVDEPLSLEKLRGRVVVALAFQMLCPGCVEHALPQVRRIAERFNPDEVTVIGLHTVFEHHAVMTPAALAAFRHEYKLPFPIMVDAAGEDSDLPKTMTAYEMQGTPTLLLFDRAGRLRRHYFGRPDDMLIAAQIMALAAEPADSPRQVAAGIERLMAKTLREPGHDGHQHAHHHHEHGEACGDGCGHDHSHDHGHEHHHAPEPVAAPVVKGKRGKGAAS
jgi:peroxiredoxin